jgi:hypothetical protein
MQLRPEAATLLTGPMDLDASRPRGIATIAAGCLLLSILFFAPRLWLMRDYVPGSFQWDRGHTYLQQCEQPFRRDIEPAMQWRLLPPVVAHYLGLRGRAALGLPWAGVLALLGYVAVLHARRLPDARFVFGGTLLVATTSAVLVPVGWLGINDAWVWLGLLAVAFGRAGWAAPVACLLCPWIDERFVIGLPLAWIVRCLDGNASFFSRDLLAACWLLPYIGLRIAFGGNPATNSAASHFLGTQWHSILVFVPMAPIGWWMGLRAGWAGLVYAAYAPAAGRRLLAGLVLAATLGASLFLASDISRSAAIVLPAMVLGGFALARREPDQASNILLIAGCTNLVIPAAHVILTHIDLINPLPVEIFRLLRSL